MAFSLATSALIGGALSAGASVYGASQAKGAAKDALNADLAAQERARQDAAAATAKVEGLQQPYLQGGQGAFEALLGEYGLAQPRADYAGYLASQPDVAAWAASDGDPTNDAAQAAQHYQQFGQAEGRQLQTTQPGVQKPPAWSPPTYGASPTAPTLQGVPGAPNLSAAEFESSPLYNLGLAEGQRNLNQNFGARGLLKSGAAIKGALDFARENVKNNYTSFANTALAANQQNQYAAAQNNSSALNLYSQTANQYNNDRNFDYGQYGDGINYQTNRYDTGINNLFNLANVGQNAAGRIGEAAQGYAGTSGNLALAGGQSRGAYADAVGSANSQMVGSLAGIGRNLFSGMGTGGGQLQPVADPVSPYAMSQPAAVPGYVNFDGPRLPARIF